MAASNPARRRHRLACCAVAVRGRAKRYRRGSSSATRLVRGRGIMTEAISERVSSVDGKWLPPSLRRATTGEIVHRLFHGFGHGPRRPAQTRRGGCRTRFGDTAGRHPCGQDGGPGPDEPRHGRRHGVSTSSPGCVSDPAAACGRRGSHPRQKLETAVQMNHTPARESRTSAATPPSPRFEGTHRQAGCPAPEVVSTRNRPVGENGTGQERGGQVEIGAADLPRAGVGEGRGSGIVGSGDMVHGNALSAGSRQGRWRRSRRIQAESRPKDRMARRTTISPTMIDDAVHFDFLGWLVHGPVGTGSRVDPGRSQIVLPVG